GRYRFANLAPGEYSLVATNGSKMWAEANVTLAAQDLTVPLTLQPFLTLAGRVVFEGSAVPGPQAMRYPVSSTGAFPWLLSRAPVGTVLDGAFSNDSVPGKYQIHCTNIPAGWYPKSAIARGQDAFDLPITVGPNDRLTELVVTFTDKPSELTGSLIESTGRP